MTVLGTKSDPVPQSTSQQFPAAKGAGGRGEALKSYSRGIRGELKMTHLGQNGKSNATSDAPWLNCVWAAVQITELNIGRWTP